MAIWVPDDQEPTPDKVFVLANPADLLHKLYWEIRELKKALSGPPEKVAFTHAPAYHAFNCCVTAWHLSDWVWESAMPEQRVIIADRLADPNILSKGSFQKAIVKHSRAIHLCRQIATGSKHMRVTDHPDPNVRAEMTDWSSEPARVGEINAGDPLARFSYNLVIRDGDDTRPAADVFDDAFRQWDRWLSEWSFKEGGPVEGRPLHPEVTEP